MLRACAQCGKNNRIPEHHLADAGRCGACKTPFGPVSEPIDVGSAEDFGAIVRDAKVPVLVDFWADWCGPCRMAAPVVKRVAENMAGRALVLKVDTERLPQVAGRYGVQGIPNFVVLRQGRVAVQHAGVVDERTMRGWLERTA